MEEVLNRENANLSIVISEIGGLKRVLEKVYFHIDDDGECGKAVAWTAEHYGYLMSPNTRIDCYQVICGQKVVKCL